MHLLKLDLNSVGDAGPHGETTAPDLPDQALLPAGARRQAFGPEVQDSWELWPPASLARRMEVRERELQRMLDEMRRSIDHLRRDRELLIGQLRDLPWPIDWPTEAGEGDVQPAQTARTAGKGRSRKASTGGRRNGRRRAQAKAAQPAAAEVQILVAAPPIDGAASTTQPAAEAAAPEAPAPAEPPPQPRTPDEEFDALVQRLRTPPPEGEAAPDAPAARAAIGPGRLAAVAATAALMVLGTPTLGQVQDDSGPHAVPSRTRFLDVMTPSQVGVRVARQATGEAPAPNLRVELTTLRPTWIQAVIDDGWQIEQVVAGGVTIPVDGQSTISLILSDAGAVRLRVNGEDQGTAGDDGKAVARQFESSTVVTGTPSSEGTTPE